ncbi:hypothetical protein EHW97_11220 [Aeromicrobium camelliae]|uniref:Uncharacterized protein n=1 Tax=Aeromicrobium camelliae TaxID=1538144 RepID=A0A3N6WMY2_9ACTN|nr:hypothetical protein [Aeromicrobium camelliae]RQN02998.1 hypothetical protein EHW97_11220 [Aeromicrobium camelliae]
MWIVVVWADGVKEFPIEDYPPWTYVAEMRSGYLDWNDGADPSRFGRYEVEWMPPQQAGDERARLGIRSSDF